MDAHEVETEKQRLIALLDEARRLTDVALDAADPDHIVHPDTQWTAKDVAGHILVWEEEALRSLEALAAGEAYYVIADFTTFEDYNARDVAQRRAHTLTHLRAELTRVRERAKAILRDLPAETFTLLIPFPWPGNGWLSDMMSIMAAHERSHARQILDATP